MSSAYIWLLKWTCLVWYNDLFALEFFKPFEMINLQKWKLRFDNDNFL